MEPHRAPSDRRPCPHCESEKVSKHGHKAGRQRFRCRSCGKTFTSTYGTPLYRLHTPAGEIALALLIVMRRGSLSAAEEITGHKYETVGRWLRLAGAQAQAITEALVRELALSVVEVDAFWSFVKKSTERLEQQTPRRRGWAALQEKAQRPTARLKRQSRDRAGAA